MSITILIEYSGKNGGEKSPSFFVTPVRFEKVLPAYRNMDEKNKT